MFEKIKRFFIHRKYVSCSEQIIERRRFFRRNILINPCGFSDLSSEKRFQIYEEEILIHIPYEAYEIYKNMFGKNFEKHLMLDAFGYSDLKYEVVEDVFIESCRNVERKQKSFSC